nr:unnamed protein product [Leishmania braziliensis]
MTANDALTALLRARKRVPEECVHRLEDSFHSTRLEVVLSRFMETACARYKEKNRMLAWDELWQVWERMYYETLGGLYREVTPPFPPYTDTEGDPELLPRKASSALNQLNAGKASTHDGHNLCQLILQVASKVKWIGA